MNLGRVRVLDLCNIIINQTGHRVDGRGGLLGMEEMEVLRRVGCDDGGGAYHGVLSEADRLVND